MIQRKWLANQTNIMPPQAIHIAQSFGRIATHSLASLALLALLGIAPRSAQAGTVYLNPVFGVKAINNLVYGYGAINNGKGTESLLMNLYEPTNIGVSVPSSRPTLLYIHGGGFTSGSKDDAGDVSLSSLWASCGYNVVAIDYRLLGDNPPTTSGPAGKYPYPAATDNEINAAIQDATMALKWTYTNAAMYGIDTNHIGIAGESAGAMMAQAVAYLVPPRGETPKVVLDLIGAMYNQVSSIKAGGPTAFVVHGTIDTTLPFAQDQAFVNQLNKVNIYNQFYVEKNTGHEVNWALTYGGQTLSQRALDFLANRLAPAPTESVAATSAALVAVPEPATALSFICGALLVWFARARFLG